MVVLSAMERRVVELEAELPMAESNTQCCINCLAKRYAQSQTEMENEIYDPAQPGILQLLGVCGTVGKLMATHKVSGTHHGTDLIGLDEAFHPNRHHGSCSTGSRKAERPAIKFIRTPPLVDINDDGKAYGLMHPEFAAKIREEQKAAAEREKMVEDVIDSREWDLPQHLRPGCRSVKPSGFSQSGFGSVELSWLMANATWIADMGQDEQLVYFERLVEGNLPFPTYHSPDEWVQYFNSSILPIFAKQEEERTRPKEVAVEASAPVVSAPYRSRRRKRGGKRHKKSQKPNAPLEEDDVPQRPAMIPETGVNATMDQENDTNAAAETMTTCSDLEASKVPIIVTGGKEIPTDSIEESSHDEELDSSDSKISPSSSEATMTYGGDSGAGDRFCLKEYMRVPAKFGTNPLEVRFYKDDRCPLAWRTVLVDGLPSGATTAEILNNVRGGTLLSVKFAECRNMRFADSARSGGWNCLLIEFASERDAKRYVEYCNDHLVLVRFACQKAPLRLLPQIIKSPTREIPLDLDLDMHERGLTRIIYLELASDDVQQEAVFRELRKISKDLEFEVTINRPLRMAMTKYQQVVLEFDSVIQAAAAWNAAVYDAERLAVVEMGFLPDPCNDSVDTLQAELAPINGAIWEMPALPVPNLPSRKEGKETASDTDAGAAAQEPRRGKRGRGKRTRRHDRGAQVERGD